MQTTDALLKAMQFGLKSDEYARAQVQLSSAVALARRGGLRPFPHAVRKMMEVLKDPDFKMSALEHAMSSDPAVMTRVLQLANSAASGGAPVITIREAIVRLGVKSLQELVVVIAMRKMFRDVDGPAQLVVDHGAQVANFIRAMAGVGFRAPEGTSLCGMLQDIGKLLLIESGEFDYGFDGPICGFESTAARERQALGYDHAIVGAVAVCKWKLPEPIATVVSCHHQLKKAIAISADVGKRVATLGVAEKVLHARQRAEALDEETTALLLADAAFGYLKVDASGLSALWGLFEVDSSLVPKRSTRALIASGGLPNARKRRKPWRRG